jgi:hypothetical protein
MTYLHKPFQHKEGICALRVFALAGGELSEVVWELVGFTHDTNNLWDLGQVKIFATEVRVILQYKHGLF